MRTQDRARRSALVLLATAAATAAVGVAALARTGAALCAHRVLVHHHDPAMAMAAGTAVSGAVPADGVCSILLYAAAAATSLCLAAVFVLAARPVARALAAAFRLMAPGADAPWFVGREIVLVPARARHARRRPSRAPPILR